MITFHDPRGEVATAMEAYALQHDFSDAQPVTIGLLANGFPDSENFLQALAAVLKGKIPTAIVKVWNKGNASIPAPESMLAEIKATCQVAIAAYGHWGSCTTGTVRDGINIARLGLPSVALVTEDFWPQGDFVARSLGMPDAPRVKLPHPVAGTGEANLRRVAETVVDEILGQFAGKAA